MLDYATLRIIWWVLLGILLIGFAVMDGFDLGIGILLHRVAKTDIQRRVALNSIGPVWEGNQIWLILAGGAIFAAWPMIYAVSFSGMYFGILLVLLALILRPVGFKYRSKMPSTTWRRLWDLGLFIAGFVPALVFGLAMGNVLQGVPFHFDRTLRVFYTGSFHALFNPFALICACLSVCMLAMHGGAFLCMKTTATLQKRAAIHARLAAFFTIVLFALGGFWVSTHLLGFALAHPMLHDGPSNPLHKVVYRAEGAWLGNYATYPIFLIAPVLGFLGALLLILCISFRHYRTAWVSSALSVAGIVATVGVSMFPFILPSSENPNMSLTIWDASSSQHTLSIMLVATFIFMPIVLTYTSWVYYVLRGKVTQADIHNNTRDVY